MNIIQLQERLKDMSEQQLAQEIKNPSGMAPTFLVATELDRRNKMKQRYAERAPQSTVVDDLTAGMGLGAMMAQDQMMQKPVQKMFGGGFLARMLPFMGRGRQAVVPSSLPSPVIGSGATVGRTGIAPQSGGTNMPMTPIDPSKLPVPYVEPTRMQRGLNFLRGNKGKALIGGPIGAGLYFMGGGEGLGDGTMQGMYQNKYGLSPEEYELLLQEAQKRDIDPYDTDRFGQLAQAVVGGRDDLRKGMEAVVSGAGTEQKKQKSLFDLMAERDKRRKDYAILQAGLGMIGSPDPLLQTVSREGKKLVGQLAKEGDEAFQFQKAMALANAKAKGNLPELIKYRTELGKQLANVALSADQRAQVLSAIQQLDARIQQMMGVTQIAQSGISMDTIKAEQERRAS